MIHLEAFQEFRSGLTLVHAALVACRILGPGILQGREP